MEREVNTFLKHASCHFFQLFAVNRSKVVSVSKRVLVEGRKMSLHHLVYCLGIFNFSSRKTAFMTELV